MFPLPLLISHKKFFSPYYSCTTCLSSFSTVFFINFTLLSVGLHFTAPEILPSPLFFFLCYFLHLKFSLYDFQNKGSQLVVLHLYETTVLFFYPFLSQNESFPLLVLLTPLYIINLFFNLFSRSILCRYIRIYNINTYIKDI